MDKSLQANILSPEHWIRVLFMLLFALLVQLAAAVMWVVVVVQFLFCLCSGQPQPRLAYFAQSLASFIYQCWQFLSYGSDDKPYPFQDWPSGDRGPLN